MMIIRKRTRQNLAPGPELLVCQFQQVIQQIRDNEIDYQQQFFLWELVRVMNQVIELRHLPDGVERGRKSKKAE